MTDTTPQADTAPADATPTDQADAVDAPAATTDDVAAPAEESGDDTAATPAARGTGVQRLEEEGDVAADYLEELLDILDLDGDIDIDVENGRAAVSVVADPGSERALKRLVGRDGEVLDALQELTRLAVQARTGERTRLMLDVAGHRADRRSQLEQVASRAVDTVKESGERLSLEPMTPFERKVVHDVVAAAGLRSESEGEDAGRHVVVLPA
ncbi:single-stranded DNA-binding protein [Angustibacter speluncae]